MSAALSLSPSGRWRVGRGDVQALEMKRGWLVPAARLHRVAMVLGRHGFGELAERMVTGRGDGDLVRDRERIGERVARVLTDLGPTYIKLGQLLATREDVFPSEVTRALGQLSSSVRPMRPRVVARAIRAALGRAPEEAFAWFDAEPLAAASIGQVHRARLRSGEDVVVKVQRPGLKAMIAADLQLLRWLAGLLERAMPEVAAMGATDLVDAFERSITSELDFRREAANAGHMARLLAGAPEVRVPRVYAEWTRPTLLVLEHVHGRRLSELDEATRHKARANLVRAFTRQILEHGVFHADPHPGNVLVENDGRLVLLDLGAVDGLDAELRGDIARLVRAVALGRKRALCEAVLALSPNGSAVSVDRARLEADLQEILASARSRNEGAKVLGQMVAVGRSHRLRMQPQLVALVRALALLDGVVRGLDPARDLVADLRRELMLSVARRARRAFGGVLSRAGRLAAWAAGAMGRAFGLLRRRLKPRVRPRGLLR